jgi:D-glycerate 3-kinase
VDVIIFEGWCVGAKPQPEAALAEPVNSLEAERDVDGVWRNFFNRALTSDYQPLFDSIDKLIMLRAPSFGTVFNWRLEQERKMIARLAEQKNIDRTGVMSEAQVAEFIAHYQRITEFSLEEMPSRSGHLFQLDAQRQIIDYSGSANLGS